MLQCTQYIALQFSWTGRIFPAMSAFDGADLLEEDFPAAEKTTAKARSRDREELESQSVGLAKRITDLNRELEEVERERATVEESRRRLTEFETGRDEMLHDLPRGLGLLEEAEHDGDGRLSPAEFAAARSGSGSL